MPRLFERITIAGVGLIGGSLGAAVKALDLAGEVVGFGRSRANLETALDRGLIDRFEDDAAVAARGADLLVLAVPVGAMARVLATAAPELASDAIITDVGSTKAAVVSEVEAVLPAGIPFVGAHPIAGGEDTGAAAADAKLFQDRECIVTPSDRSTAAATAKIIDLWRAVGMRVTEMDAVRHDQILAWVSHLPHAIAFALARAVDPEFAKHGGQSWADLTRIAASSPEMWRDIFRTNAAAMEQAIAAMIASLAQLQEQIRAGDSQSLQQWLQDAQAAKRGWSAGS